MAEKREEHGLVFSSAVGKSLDAAYVRDASRRALKEVDGINADEWTPAGGPVQLRVAALRAGRPLGGDLPARRTLG